MDAQKSHGKVRYLHLLCRCFFFLRFTTFNAMKMINEMFYRILLLISLIGKWNCFRRAGAEHHFQLRWPLLNPSAPHLSKRKLTKKIEARRR